MRPFLKAEVWLLLIALAATGCGPSTRRVWGEVTLEGKPVAEGTIEFLPEAGTAGPSTGTLIQAGRYDLESNKGLLAGGTYKVSIAAMAKTGNKQPHPITPSVQVEEIANLIPLRYNNRTTLQITVAHADAENQRDFHLQK
jgi:hypothetical protein